MNREHLSGKNILVLGYAMTGKSVAHFLLENGANVTINDRSDLMSDESIHELLNLGAKVVGNGHPIELLDEPIDFIVKNPGIPYHNELLSVALNRGIAIYTDVELFSWFNLGKLVGITGSNGKTTTTTLVNEILKNSSLTSHLAGNIGIPTLSVLPNVNKEDIVVMELSSFQLMGTEQFRPHIAAITNIFEAHLDYHGSREEYIKAKLKLISNQVAEDYLVINADDAELLILTENANAKKVLFARVNITEEIKKNGAYYQDSGLYFKEERIVDVDDIQIPGEHNIENILAAIAVTKLLGIDNETISSTIAHYQGVPYRIQPIGEFGGVAYYNDSKATNPTATITALSSFNQPIVYIGGGLDRGIGFDELLPHLDNVKIACLYGESKYLMEKTFRKANIKTIIVDTLVEATASAIKEAESGDIVLLSPSCASWDQFKSYEVRGALFTELVSQLK